MSWLVTGGVVVVVVVVVGVVERGRRTEREP
jgi:hypothetical protein